MNQASVIQLYWVQDCSPSHISAISDCVDFQIAINNSVHLIHKYNKKFPFITFDRVDLPIVSGFFTCRA